jgi:hypothetical protein
MGRSGLGIYACSILIEETFLTGKRQDHAIIKVILQPHWRGRGRPTARCSRGTCEDAAGDLGFA